MGLCSPASAAAGTVYIGDVGTVSAARADCGPGSLPETGLQGDVPAEDRNSGRSTQGYRCNLTRLGGFQDKGAGIVSASYDHCSYTGTLFPGSVLNEPQGVQVLDVSDPNNPVLSTTLREPAMLGGTWETLKVNTERKLLAATAVPLVFGAGYFSVYDISDCAHPRLLNTRAGTDLTTPLPFLTHEGGFSPDGNTYWASGIGPGVLSAIDISDPTNPHVIWNSLQGLSEHGFGISPDGNTMYLSVTSGINILDISAIQRRDPYPVVPQYGTYLWQDGQFNQHSVPVTYGGKPFIFSPDEAGSGGVKVFDVSNPADAKLVNRIKLEINIPANINANLRSSGGGGVFSYDSHYCSADRPADPTALACSWFSSGIRVFDVRDPANIREIAYYNPPAQKNRALELTNSPHALSSFLGVPFLEFAPIARAIADGKIDPAVALGPRAGNIIGDLSSDWCSSPPAFHGNQVWATCSDNGFMALQLDNNVYRAPANQHTVVGS
ncbi:hypothetical protein OG921_15665 [Aldersonia sp. NBC_00410]|uniref:LVIVD repeat-containing protein n=1 Tax=Aldersonia sp. NBC_00410 TaxID=2975954 RepID=UPI002251C823|nr:hypothetical protein [Aldersonia sp. NBC_00410]MCX5044608.1 hypothetical protein [Aldersonia sp. NBC_00410]